MPCYTVDVGLTLTVEAEDHEAAEEEALRLAEQMIWEGGKNVLIAQPAEETECDA